MADQLQVGDTVKLKTSVFSPEMIIDRLTSEEGVVECVWYSPDAASFKREQFSTTSLKKFG